VKAVHSDITALLAAGIFDRTSDGEIEFPFDAVKVEFCFRRLEWWRSDDGMVSVPFDAIEIRFPLAQVV
jgi:hypothetical protein